MKHTPTHTPGPWTIERAPHPHGGTMNRVMAGHEPICDPLQTHEDRDESEENARLISAAPDLLAALQWAIVQGRITYTTRIPGQNEAWCNGVDRIRAAIAKATGVQS